jgi:uncharacterized membrane protein YobD (UPF0266 family)
MPSREEIKSALLGAADLARLDASGMGRFDLSIEGFWNSFFAAALAAPGYLILVLDAYATEGAPADLGLVFFVETIAYAANWIVFPLAAALLTRVLGLGARYVPLIVAGNWAAVLQVALLVVALAIGSLAPGDLRSPLLLAALAAVMVYQWFVIRTALQTSGGIALAFLVIDVLLSRLINLSADSFTQAG